MDGADNVMPVCNMFGHKADPEVTKWCGKVVVSVEAVAKESFNTGEGGIRDITQLRGKSQSLRGLVALMGWEGTSNSAMGVCRKL